MAGRRWRKLGSAGVLLCIFSLLFLLFLFVSSRMHSRGHESAVGIPRTAIIFTGRFDRIRFGLKLMENSQIDRLFISGVNGGAGIEAAKFAKQFDLSAMQRQYLNSGAIVLATGAQSTIENAFETACWLQDQPQILSFNLITSESHMARAYIALKKVHPVGIGIIRLTVPRESVPIDYQLQVREFLKYSITWIMLSIPKRYWSDDSNLHCNVS